MNLIKIGGENFILNFESMTKLLTDKEDLSGPLTGKEVTTVEIYGEKSNPSLRTGKEVTTRVYDKDRQIDVSKYETLRTLIDIVLSTNEEMDDTLGTERGMKQMPIPFKLAFNTLLYYNVLEKIDI